MMGLCLSTTPVAWRNKPAFVINVVIHLWLYLLALPAATLAASVKDSRMEEVIITAVQSQPLIDMPRSVSLIDEDEIDRSGAQSLQELLARQANISVNSFTGNDKFSRIDMRGSGDTASSNILVLVDGVKYNAPDLKGADLSLVPMQRIERIEIVRGANSVRYGSGATHGVINIITRKTHDDGAFLSARHQSGDFRNETSDITAGLSTDDQIIDLHINRFSDQGFRASNSLLRESWSLGYRTTLTEATQLALSTQQHRDDYELPGPLSQEELQQFGRRFSNPDKRQSGHTEDKNLVAGLSWKINDAVSLTHNTLHRERFEKFSLDSLSGTIDHTRLQSTEYNLALNANILSQALDFTLGIQHREDAYSRSENGYQREAGDALNQAEIDQTAWYIQFSGAALSRIDWQAGYRRDTTKNTYKRLQFEPDTTSPLCDFIVIPGSTPKAINCPVAGNLAESRNNRWRSEALELAALLPLNKQINIYTSLARSFRHPNADELALSPVGLTTQVNEHAEAGIKFYTAQTELSIGYFYTRSDDEIIYRQNPETLREENFNFPETIRREGVEVDFRYYPFDWLTLDAALGYLHTRSQQGLRLPLIPSTTATLHAGFQHGAFSLDAYASHVSERLDGNDFNNQLFDNDEFKLSAYTTFALRAAISINTLTNARWQLFAGANNLGNRTYSSTAYSKTLYPANPQTFYGGIRLDL